MWGSNYYYYPASPPATTIIDRDNHNEGAFFLFDFILEKPATRPRDRCGTEQLLYPFVTGFPGSSRVSALAPYSSGGRVGSTLSTPHAGGDVGLFVGECSSPQTDAPKQRRGMSHQRPDLSSHSSCDDPRLKFQIGREARALRSDVVVVATMGARTVYLLVSQ